MGHFKEYSKYYDLLYKDKNYKKEADYVDHLIRKYDVNSKTLLDIGCGTGKHANLMAEKGYRVNGIDLSENMLSEAMASFGDKLLLSKGDIRNFKLDKSFDIITSLFHVISYQTRNSDLYNSFQSVYNHLNDGGYFIFDCWYGPGVLSDHPKVKVKRMSDDELDIIRIAEPVFYPNECVVDVNFDITIKEKVRQTSIHLTELHPMRYLFKNEIEMLCDKYKFKFIDYFAWLTFEKPTSKDWYAVFILKK
jgi:SAM-dependent methyltransferase